MRRGVHNKREMGVLPLGGACSGVHLILGNGGCMLRGVLNIGEYLFSFRFGNLGKLYLKIP